MTETISPADCALRLKGLADETRLTVVRSLLAGPKHVGEINESLGLEASLLSHHLRVLRCAGIVTARRDGKAVLYQLATDVDCTPNGIDFGCCSISFS